MKINKKDIFSFIILWFFFSFTFYISWIISLFKSILNLIIIVLLFLWFYIVIKKIFRSKIILTPKEFISRIVFIYSIIIFLVASSIGYFAYYFNEKSPAYLPEYTLTNWEKTVVFQWMMHIWWENFYNQVSKNLENYRKKDFVHFFEWVKPGSEENMKELNKALWFEFDKNLYPNISKLLWISFQDYEKIMWKITEKDINVDISIDEIIEEYKKLKTSETIENNEIIQTSKEMENLLQKTNQRELKLINYLAKAFINAMLSSEENLKNLSSWWENQEIMKAILDKRDKHLAEEIQKSEYQKIYVTYGLLHFNWVLKNLQERDKNWKIEKIEKYKAL